MTERDIEQLKYDKETKILKIWVDGDSNGGDYFVFKDKYDYIDDLINNRNEKITETTLKVNNYCNEMDIYCLLKGLKDTENCKECQFSMCCACENGDVYDF